MAIQVNYLEDGVGIEIKASGVVRGEEIIDAHEEIYKPDHLYQQKYHIIDRSAVEEYYVSAEEIESIATLDKNASKINPDIIIAIISPNELSDMIACLWQEHVDDHVYLTERFHSREVAEKWIEQNLG